MKKAIVNSWQTTLGGVLLFGGTLAVAIGAAIDGNPETVANWGSVAAALPVMLALFAARDNSVSSKDAGAE